MTVVNRENKHDSLLNIYLYCDQGPLPRGQNSPFFNVENIFEPELLEQIGNHFRRTAFVPRVDDLREDFEFVERGSFFPHPIIFGQDNQVTNLGTLHSTNELFNRMHQVALTKFGKLYDLKGMHQFSLSALRYNIGCKTHEHGPKHYDFCTRNSMVIMLSDHNDPSTGWKGGNLVVSPGDPHIRDLLSKAAIERVYLLNSAMFFNNVGTSHWYTEIEGRTEKSERIILTYFQREEGSTYTYRDPEPEEEKRAWRV